MPIGEDARNFIQTNLGVQAAESAAVAQHNMPRRRHRDDPGILKQLERGRHCLDSKAEIVGDVLTRHRQLDLLASGIAR
jgi:hypothetical protein